jgi:hypothetical protein
MSLWKMRCLLCEKESYNLIIMQEHVMRDHEVSQKDLQKQSRSPDSILVDQYIFSLPDGRPWLEAAREET